MIGRIHPYRPDDIALIDPFGSLTYRELTEWTDRATERFRNGGHTGQRLIVQGNNDRHLVSSVLALLQSGNTVLLQEPGTTPQESHRLIRKFGAGAVLISGPQETYTEVAAKTVPPAGLHGKRRLCYASSGSTGEPKIFGYAPDQLADLLRAWTEVLGQTPGDCMLCPLTITHFHGTMLCFGTLMTGGTVLFTDPGPLNIRSVWQIAETFRPTLMSGTPYFYSRLLRDAPDPAPNAFPKLRRAVCGSAPMSAELSEQCRKRFGFALHQGYGLSEIGTICLNTEPLSDPGSVGRVIPGIEYRIINDEGRPVTTDEPGELIVRAPFMTEGYIDDPDMTARMFRDGWLYTGDIVTEDPKKRLTIVGRKSTFINIHGAKVYPAEIEKVIAAFRLGLSVAVAETTTGGKPVICAYLECDEPIDTSALKVWCAARLTGFKRPRKFIQVDRLPKNDIGKVRFHQLRS